MRCGWTRNSIVCGPELDGLGRLGRHFLTYARARAQAYMKWYGSRVSRAHARNLKFGVPGVPEGGKWSRSPTRHPRPQAFRAAAASPALRVRVDTARWEHEQHIIRTAVGEEARTGATSLHVTEIPGRFDRPASHSVLGGFAAAASFRCGCREGGAPSPLRSFAQGGKAMSGDTRKRWRRADRSQPAAGESSNRPTKEGAHE